MLREGMFIAERYEILEKIGSGGMSDVYKAKCHKLNRFVAMKVLKAEFSEDKTFVSKFRAEAQAAAGLMHSNIVNVYDVGEEQGIYFIVMELVEGITLKKYIDKKGRLGVREAVSIAIQVAQGIEAAHKHEIVHRDIKPQNIIISKEGKVKVTDFGIARAVSSNTINSSVMGSVHYISPEQARGGYSDQKSDVYSFGITLFEMLTGRVPFEGDTTVAVALQHIQDDMISPSKFVTDIPISVEKIVMKCTQKKTERRYQVMSDLIADLKRSLVTPDEDFVVISSVVVPDSPTQMFGKEELDEIALKASVKPGVEVIPPARTEEESLLTDEDIEEEDVLEIPPESNKLDKIITYMGIGIAVTIVVIIIVLAVKMGLLFSGDNSSGGTTETTTTVSEDGSIEVPNLLGYTYDEAKEKLNELGLGIKKDTGYTSLYDEGKIFEQSVDAGEKVTANTQIIVTVSLGVETFNMPDVTGKDKSTADATLTGKGLVLTYAYKETDDDTLIGTVVSTSPVAGTSVKSGDEVTVTIYKGTDVVTAEVPNVVGQTESDARKAIESAGFTVGTVSTEYSETVTKGQVISQSGDAKAGEKAEVDAGVTINMVVSGGPEPTTVETTTETTTATTSHTVTGSIKVTDIETAITNGGFDKTKVVNLVVKIYVTDSANTTRPIFTSSAYATFDDIVNHGAYDLSTADQDSVLVAGSGTAYAVVTFDTDTLTAQKVQTPVTNVTID